MRAPGISIAAFALALPLLASCSEETGEAPQIIRPVLSTVVAERDETPFGFAGSIEPRVSAELSFRLLGRVIARDVDVGDLVKKGATIATLDFSALQLQVQAARADLSSAEAQFANAAASEERQRALLQSKNTPQSVYDTAVQARDAAQASVEQAKAALAKAQEQSGYTQLFSDFDGIVTETGAEVGQVVSPGQMVVTVARSDARDAVVDIPDQIAVAIPLGSVFGVALQSAPSIIAQGKLREVSPQADAATRTRRMKLSLLDPSPSFRLGSTVTVTRQEEVRPQIILPQSALLDDGGRTAVWVVDTGGTVGLRPVTLGGRGPGFFSVVGGLEPGARVVTAGVHSLTQGQKVKVDVEELPQ